MKRNKKSTLLQRTGQGLLAGAAGTIALNVATYEEQRCIEQTKQ